MLVMYNVTWIVMTVPLTFDSRIEYYFVQKKLEYALVGKKMMLIYSQSKEN